MVFGSETLNSHQFIIDPEDWYMRKRDTTNWTSRLEGLTKYSCGFTLFKPAKGIQRGVEIYWNYPNIKKSMTFQALLIPMCCHLCSISSVCSFWSDLGFTHHVSWKYVTSVHKQLWGSCKNTIFWEKNCSLRPKGAIFDWLLGIFVSSSSHLIADPFHSSIAHASDHQNNGIFQQILSEAITSNPPQKKGVCM